MKDSLALTISVCAALAGVCGCARGADVTECSQAQLLAYTPTEDEVTAHRQFKLPTINYALGTKRDDWGLDFDLRVDEQGRVICYAVTDEWHQKQSLNDERRHVIAGLKDWRYSPFGRNDNAVAAIVSETVNEEELPEKHLSLPDVPLTDVTIVLARSGCFGTCPSYQVELDGSGHAVYTGRGYVDVVGTHVYHVEPEQVAKLVQTLRGSDVWSLRASYFAPITDSPTYNLTIKMGESIHRIEDYVGNMVGMPASVSAFENDVDRVAGSDAWVHLSRDAVERLEAEHFKFISQAGADLLARAVANPDSRDHEAILRVLNLGAPISGSKPSELSFGYRSEGPLIEEALRNQRALLVDPLIARGALRTTGQPDQEKIDAAFRAAIGGGLLAPAQKIWAQQGARMHPALTFQDVAEDNKRASKTSPVTLLLHHHRYDRTPWEGLKIAQWLALLGCDLKAASANGTTLLHIATQAGDADFVRYMLEHGVPASTPGEYGLPALGGAEEEDIALILLEAGTDVTKMDTHGSGSSFRGYAEYNHWARVIEWLDAHKQ